MDIDFHQILHIHYLANVVIYGQPSSRGGLKNKTKLMYYLIIQILNKTLLAGIISSVLVRTLVTE